MQILPISVCQSQKKSSQPNFGGVYPVIHWVAEEGGMSYAPVVTEKLTTILQGKLVRRFNKSLVGLEEKKAALIRKIQSFLVNNDKDYSLHRYTRSYYDKEGGWGENKFKPISYLITGQDAVSFENDYGKPIGKIRNLSPKRNGRRYSADLRLAQIDYYKKGLNFVKAKSGLFRDEKGTQYSLHTKFIIHRKKSGEIKDYELVGMKFCPNEGKSNPFVKLGYIKE